MKIFRQRVIIPHTDRLLADFHSERYIEEAKASLAKQVVESEDVVGATETDFAGTHVELMLFTISPSNWYKLRDFLQEKLSAEEFIKFKEIIEEK